MCLACQDAALWRAAAIQLAGRKKRLFLGREAQSTRATVTGAPGRARAGSTRRAAPRLASQARPRSVHEQRQHH
jgi:hypothetical protein